MCRPHIFIADDRSVEFAESFRHPVASGGDDRWQGDFPRSDGPARARQNNLRSHTTDFPAIAPAIAVEYVFMRTGTIGFVLTGDRW